MKYYIVAGEASGDLHASNLMRELKELDHAANFRCWGGDLMKKQGGELVKHYRELAFMGFVEVIRNLRTILKNIEFCKQDILDYKPDVVILVDYPGFNLRIAEFLHKRRIKVFYYISPQIWAWKQSRVHKIKKAVDRMFVILPFEKDFYRKFDCEVDFVGHPLLDAIDNTGEEDLGKYEKPIIALLPGSRRQEIAKMLPVMLSVVDRFPGYQFVIGGAPSVPASFYEQFTGGNVGIEFNKTYALLRKAKAALVTSGTATLETALFEVPEVVCYSANTISYHIARKLIKVRYISLVNLIMDREIVKELIQKDFNTFKLSEELEKLLFNPEKRAGQLRDFKELKQRLGGRGASRKAAELMTGYLRSE
jgi:lipid-A-disaccharide synthase